MNLSHCYGKGIVISMKRFIKATGVFLGCFVLSIAAFLILDLDMDLWDRRKKK